MGKLFRKTNVSENSFEASPGGSSGVLNYQTPYGTPGGGNIVQDPSHFASSKSDAPFQPNTHSGSASPDSPEQIGRPDTQAKSIEKLDQTTSPDSEAEKMKSQKPLDPTKEFDPQIDQVFQKKDTPSPDEVMAGLQYEMSNMVKKDKTIAKQTVLNNLKKDPHYYSRLNMLNIDDKDMKVDEIMKENQTKLVNQSTFEKTKALLDAMVADRQKNIVVANTPEITKIFKDLSDKRHSRMTGQEQ